MSELKDEIIRHAQEEDEQEANEIRYRRETFWFNTIIWGSLSTIPIGFVIILAGALVTGFVFICIGIAAMVLMVLGALFAAG